MTDLSPQFPLPRSGSRPEAMADVPGICELALTRAVVQYRNLHDVDLPEGRIEDIGQCPAFQPFENQEVQVVVPVEIDKPDDMRMDQAARL